jgi:hypothetical protein
MVAAAGASAGQARAVTPAAAPDALDPAVIQRLEDCVRRNGIPSFSLASARSSGWTPTDSQRNVIEQCAGETLKVLAVDSTETKRRIEAAASAVRPERNQRVVDATADYAACMSRRGAQAGTPEQAKSDSGRRSDQAMAALQDRAATLKPEEVLAATVEVSKERERATRLSDACKETSGLNAARAAVVAELSRTAGLQKESQAGGISR